ncbi:MAG TPA: MFS transporter [Terriglobales bacterium]|nr:MFS transporter [Terriglobales bacterium]
MPAAPSLSLSAATPAQRRTLLAAALGWMLDAFDVMLYALVLAHVMRDLGMTKGIAGLLNTLTLLASGIGGVLFGFIADRIGRARALMLSILTYSICSFASGLSTSVQMLAAFRFVLGLGMGGEWNTGATLVAETWPTDLRAKALAMVQSSWAIGYALAALIAGIVLRYANWRAVFFVGIIPALVTLWIRRSVPESEMWKQHRVVASQLDDNSGKSSFWSLFRAPYVRPTFFLLLMNFFGLFGWWGLFSWIPPYLSLPVEQGGRGFGLMGTTALLLFLNLAGMFPGYLSFGWVADRLGRRKSFVVYLLLTALLVPLYAIARNAIVILILGAVVAFFGTGFFSGSALIGSEIFPTSLRARALGFTYNGARTLSSTAPFVIGYFGQRHGLSAAFFLSAAAFLFASLTATQLPETVGKQLD